MTLSQFSRLSQPRIIESSLSRVKEFQFPGNQATPYTLVAFEISFFPSFFEIPEANIFILQRMAANYTKYDSRSFMEADRNTDGRIIDFKYTVVNITPAAQTQVGKLSSFSQPLT